MVLLSFMVVRVHQLLNIITFASPVFKRKLC